MREIALVVADGDVEDVLDELLPISPNGVHEVRFGDLAELRMRGSVAELPTAAWLSEVVGPRLIRVVQRDISNDWRERQRADYTPVVLEGVLAIRPAWAEPIKGVMNIALCDTTAFGGGSHPTTYACLELLTGLVPSGGLVDVGCGTGVLAVTAAKLGWAPVVAIDNDAEGVRAARAAAAINEVAVEVRQSDVVCAPLPRASVVCANVPPAVHLVLGPALRAAEALRWVIVSGMLSGQADEISAAYCGGRFSESRRIERDEWAAILFRRARH